MDEIPRKDFGEQGRELHYVCVIRNGEKRAYFWERE
jgi:hypothetical protein